MINSNAVSATSYFIMNTIKEMLTNDWRAKVTCLLLASALWYLISKNVEKSPQRFDRGTSASKLLKT